MLIVKKATFIKQETRHELGYVCAELPIYLISAANQREAWQKRASRTQEHRAMACFQLQRPLKAARIIDKLHGPSLEAALLVIGGRGVQVILTRVAPRPLDDDNLAYAFKAIRDGVADAMGCKDNDPRIVWTYAQRKHPAYGISIEVGILERLPAA